MANMNSPSFRLAILQAKYTALKEGLERGMADIQKFKAGHAPEAEIEELEDAWLDLRDRFRKVAWEKRVLEESEEALTCDL